VVDARTTRLEVEGGRAELVALTGGAPAVLVQPNEYAVAGDGGEPTPRPRPRATVLLVVGHLTLTPADAQVKKRLEARGFDVRLQREGPPRDEDLAQAALVLVSSSSSARDVNTTYRDLAVPLVAWEPFLFDDLGMTGAQAMLDQGFAPSTGEVSIDDPTSPLAAGLGGLTTILQPSASEPRPGFLRRMSFGLPGPHALRVASWPGHPNRAMVFAYERGVPMPGLASAPARRVGLFLHDHTASVMNDAGWALFDAAVDWCLRDAGRP
jgi:hypothetical protein